MKKGLTHIYMGDGKGKTTAAVGLAVRALGAGLTVAIFQFCKPTPTGEIQTLSKLDKISVSRAEESSAKFVWEMTPEEKKIWCDAQQALFDIACEAACDDEIDLVILDEALGAMQQGAIDQSEIRYLMKRKSKSTELVLTGREAPAELIAVADYVTEMRLVKHPHDAGIFARKGIEY